MRRIFVGICLIAACADLPTSNELIVGSWVDDSEAEDIRLTFSADGTYKREELASSLPPEGRWETAEKGNVLRLITGDGDLSQEMTFRVDEKTLLMPAWLPVGHVDGVLGRWLAETRFVTKAGDTIVERKKYEIRPDGTVLWLTERTGSGVADEERGMFAYEPGPEEGELILYDPQDPSSPRFDIHLYKIKERLEAGIGSDRFFKEP